MPSLREIAVAVYAGYAGDDERHVIRIVATVIFAALIAYFPSSLNKDALSMMGVIVSILAGFSFTALLSSHSHSVHDLPAPGNESDRMDISKLKKLFGNFRDRSKYFLTISISCLILCFLLLVPFGINKILAGLEFDFSESFVRIFLLIWEIICGIGRALCLFLFFEILYKFYRMSQTIFSIIEVRRVYLEQDRA